MSEKEELGEATFTELVKTLRHTEKKLAIFHWRLWVDYGRFDKVIIERELKKKIRQEFGSNHRTVKRYLQLLQGFEEIHYRHVGKPKVGWKFNEELVRIKKVTEGSAYKIVSPELYYKDVWTREGSIDRVRSFLRVAKERGIDPFKTVKELDAEEEAKEKEMVKE